MKKLLCSIFLSMSISAYALFPTNTSTYTIQLDVPNQGDFSDFNFVWHGYEDQFVSYYTVTNQTNYITIAPYYGLFRMSKRVSGGSNLVYVQKGTADITVTGSNAWFSVTHTNIPPNGDYLAQLLLTDTTGTNVIRSLAAGHVRVGSSLWGTNDSMWNFPVNSVWLTNNVALGTIYRVDISTGITAEVTNGTLRLSSTSGNTNGVAASLAAHQGLTSTAHGGIPTTNAVAASLNAHQQLTGVSVHGLGSASTNDSDDFYLASNPAGYVDQSAVSNWSYYVAKSNANMGGLGITNVTNTVYQGGVVGGTGARMAISGAGSAFDMYDPQTAGDGGVLWRWRSSYTGINEPWVIFKPLELVGRIYRGSGIALNPDRTNVMDDAGILYSDGNVVLTNPAAFYAAGAKVSSSTNSDMSFSSSNVTDAVSNYFRNAANLTNTTSTANTATNGTYLRANVAGGVTTLVWQVVDYSTVVTGAQSNAISTVQSTQANVIVTQTYLSNLLENVTDTQTLNTAGISGLQTTQNTYRAFSMQLSGIGTNDTNSMANYWSGPAPYACHITNIRWWADGAATGNLLRSSYLTAPSAWEGVVFSNLTTAAWAWSNYAVNIVITNGEMLNYYMIGCTNNGCDLMGTKD